MHVEGLVETLSRLGEVGIPVKVRPYRQVWRFVHEGAAYYIKLYPREGGGGGAKLKRMVRGSPALHEYNNLLKLQRAGIPSPHAVAYLSGFESKLPGCEVADAVITRALEPSCTLEEVVRAARLSGEQIAGRREMVRGVIELVASLTKAKMGHDDLHLGNILLSPPERGGKLYVLDAYAIHEGGMNAFDLEVLGFAVSSVATRTEMLRARRALVKGPPPNVRSGAVARRHWRKVVERSCSETEYAGAVTAAGWTGQFYKRWKAAVPWSAASGLTVTAEDWEREWPRLLEQMRGEMLKPLKQSASSEVWQGEVVLGGRVVEVVVKRPFRRYWYRYVTEMPRGTRAWRGWWKAWALIARGIPTAWPLATLERRGVGGVAMDQVLVCEYVRGPQLDGLDFSSLSSDVREEMFRQLGRLLRRIDETGIAHFDTKVSNFIISTARSGGLVPVFVDVDGVRTYRWRGEGLRRLLESLRIHTRQFTEQDAEHLRAGYDPFGAGSGRRR